MELSQFSSNRSSENAINDVLTAGFRHAVDFDERNTEIYEEVERRARDRSRGTDDDSALVDTESLVNLPHDEPIDQARRQRDALPVTQRQHE